MGIRGLRKCCPDCTCGDCGLTNLAYCEVDLPMEDTTFNNVVFEGVNYQCNGVSCPPTPFGVLPVVRKWFRKDVVFEVTNCQHFADIMTDNGVELDGGVATFRLPWRYHVVPPGRGSGGCGYNLFPAGGFGGGIVGYHNGGLHYNCQAFPGIGTCTSPTGLGATYSWWTSLDNPPAAPAQLKYLVFTLSIAEAPHLASAEGMKCFAVSRLVIAKIVSQVIGGVTVNQVPCRWTYCPPAGKPLDGTLCLAPSSTGQTSTCCREWPTNIAGTTDSTCVPPLPCPCPRVQNFRLLDTDAEIGSDDDPGGGGIGRGGTGGGPGF